jgi:hypothetical protein
VKRSTIGVAAAISVSLLAVGCGGAPPSAKKEAAPAAKPAGTTAAPQGATADLKPADIDLSVKTTKKDCYGSAGCLVEWRIVVAADKSKLGSESDSWLVTYEVRGVEDGPQVNSFTIYGNGKYDAEEVKGSASTTSSKAKLSAKVTEVEKS